ncbi:hypothetical protein M5K25_002889 [Dendrobium thyrsiflorum]|uniref:Uncharacterized protein n=1 Tax=Dendrobium thyrsiflorum TaxID=117978 RepID=A0ABD0VNG2_DENTH
MGNEFAISNVDVVEASTLEESAMEAFEGLHWTWHLDNAKFARKRNTNTSAHLAFCHIVHWHALKSIKILGQFYFILFRPMMTFYLYDWCRDSMSKVDSTGRDKRVRHLSACTIYVFAVSMVLPERAFEVDETNWILGSDQLQLIAQSKAIRDALNDLELQKLVYKIDSCSNPEEELEKAMEREGFPQFTEMVKTY